ncbi:suppressor APC domain-containing protein 2 [Bombina bombina]|uniref:suppressor APC domain-containing protein 2 n=1 Tax=Bombina bombina TaxID=8345 RepID=UPI00235AB334|nr:suppressor APC domain-containing protein 2 [Bombina bombina]
MAAPELPRAFLLSLRTLFDILDDGRRGSVHITEIESRWQGADSLPPGVLSCLRKVAPPDGYLTFDRFVQGLRSSLLRDHNENCRRGKPPPTRGHCKPLGTRCMNEGEAGWSQRGGGERKPMCRSQSEATSEGMANPGRHPRSRGEHRRHTISNGVDYSVLMVMKELEQEKDFLIQGLEMVERARDWYLQQIQAVQERQRNLGKTPNDYFSEGHCSNMNIWLSKLQEVNRCLSDLISPGKAGLSSPSALATSTASAVVSGGQQQAVTMLKEQNRLLTKEVSDKSDRITQLEQEKSALIKQLFEARARSNQENSQMDSTFI